MDLGRLVPPLSAWKARYGIAYRVCFRSSRLQSLIIESSPDETSPVLLFLHGKGEASTYLSELPKVAFHLSPPFRALMGFLRSVVVVAPQAPHSPDDPWNWRTYASVIGDFIQTKIIACYGKRTILATGFSRGGLGVLQVMSAHPKMVARWAIVDPQRAKDDDEQSRLVRIASGRQVGWLRYSNAMPRNAQFASLIARKLAPQNSAFVAMAHGELAFEAFAGNALGGACNLYEFLGLEYDHSRWPKPG